MWPWKKKEKPDTPKKPDHWEIFDRRVKKLKDFRDVGQTFNYLGATMLVVDHSEVRPGWEGYHCPLVAVLKCNYRDNNGVIHIATFEYSELHTPLRMNGHIKPDDADKIHCE